MLAMRQPVQRIFMNSLRPPVTTARSRIRQCSVYPRSVDLLCIALPCAAPEV